jgi:hypothetical protein
MAEAGCAGSMDARPSASRGIVSMLSACPASLAEITAKSALPGQDLLANVLVLCATDAVWPVESRRVSVSAVNEAILRRLGGSEELLYLALPCSTAVAMDDALLLGAVEEPARASSAIGKTSWLRTTCRSSVHARGARPNERRNNRAVEERDGRRRAPRMWTIQASAPSTFDLVHQGVPRLGLWASAFWTIQPLGFFAWGVGRSRRCRGCGLRRVAQYEIPDGPPCAFHGGA